MSRAIIEKHGGKLEIVKNDEVELVFKMTLPIHQNKPRKSDGPKYYTFK